MKTFDNLNADVLAIGEKYGVDVNVCPMKEHRFKIYPNETDKLNYITIEFDFSKYITNPIPQDSHAVLTRYYGNKYTYNLLPYDWNVYKEDDSRYNAFLKWIDYSVKQQLSFIKEVC